MRKKRGKLTKRNAKIQGYLISFFMLFLLLAIGYTPTNAESNKNYDYTYIGEYERGQIISYNGKRYYTEVFNVKNPDGSIAHAYCIDLQTAIKENHKYSRANIEDAEYYSNESAKKIRAIVRNSYPFVSLETVSETFDIQGLTKEEAITATQMAIWNYANDEKVEAQLSENSELLYEKLLNLSGVEGSVVVGKIEFKEPIVTKNGDKCDVEFLYKINGKNADGSDVNLEYNIEGKSDESSVIELDKDSEGYSHVKVTNIKENEVIKLSVKGIQDVGSDVFFYDPEGGRDSSQSLIGIQSGNTNISNSIEFKYTFGEVIVKKADLDDNSKVLKDAEFTIKNSNGEVVETITTGDDGSAATKLLPDKYTIEESKAPKGYVLNTEIKEFTINKDEQTKVEFTFTNKKDVGSVILTKIDSEDNSKVLNGAEFELYNEVNDKIGTYITGEYGKIIVENLVPGNYYFVEIKSPEGYVEPVKGNKIEFTIEANSTKAVELTSKNSKIVIKGMIVITKVDENNKPLEGAEFIIKNEAKEEIARGKTDKNGVVKFDNLLVGKYFYQEVTAPKGYVLDNKEYEFEIKEDKNYIVAGPISNKKEEPKNPTTSTNKPVTSNKKPSSPKTGDSGMIGVVGVLLVAGGALLAVNKKKKI